MDRKRKMRMSSVEEEWWKREAEYKGARRFKNGNEENGTKRMGMRRKRKGKR